MIDQLPVELVHEIIRYRSRRTINYLKLNRWLSFVVDEYYRTELPKLYNCPYIQKRINEFTWYAMMDKNLSNQWNIFVFQIRNWPLFGKKEKELFIQCCSDQLIENQRVPAENCSTTNTI